MSIDFHNVVNLRNGQFDSTTRAQLDQLFDACLVDVCPVAVVPAVPFI